MNLEFNGKECLPILSCDVHSDSGILYLDKGAAARLVNNPPILFSQVVVRVERICRNHEGKPYSFVPLWMVPFHWLRKLIFMFPGGRLWYVAQVKKRGPIMETIEDYVTSFEVGYLPERAL